MHDSKPNMKFYPKSNNPVKSWISAYKTLDLIDLIKNLSQKILVIIAAISFCSCVYINVSVETDAAEKKAS